MAEKQALTNKPLQVITNITNTVKKQVLIKEPPQATTPTTNQVAKQVHIRKPHQVTTYMTNQVAKQAHTRKLLQVTIPMTNMDVKQVLIKRTQTEPQPNMTNTAEKSEPSNKLVFEFIEPTLTLNILILLLRRMPLLQTILNRLCRVLLGKGMNLLVT